jgi:flagellar biosynthesis anti-sigma factor FlgM
MPEVRKTGGSSSSGAVIYDIARARLRPVTEVGAVEAADAAGFSESARELARAREAVDGAPEIRAAKVKALKRQIESGAYAADPRELARKLLETGF